MEELLQRDKFSLLSERGERVACQTTWGSGKVFHPSLNYDSTDLIMGWCLDTNVAYIHFKLGKRFL